MGIEPYDLEDLDSYERELTDDMLEVYQDRYGRTAVVESILDGGHLPEILTAMRGEIAADLGMDEETAEKLVGRIAAAAVLGDRLSQIEAARSRLVENEGGIFAGLLPAEA